MLSNILVATDLSEAANRVSECVKGLRRVGARQAVLVHVLDVPHVGGLYLALKSETDDRSRSRLLRQDSFQQILHPTDLPDVAEAAFQYLEKIVSETKSAVTLLHVRDKAGIDPHLKDRQKEFNRTDAERLERRREHLLSRGASAVNIEVLYGSPTALILEQARQKGFSLILMSTEWRGYIQELSLGSVARSVARHAPLRVLFVPAMRSETDRTPS